MQSPSQFFTHQGPYKTNKTKRSEWKLIQELEVTRDGIQICHGISPFKSSLIIKAYQIQAFYITSSENFLISTHRIKYGTVIAKHNDLKVFSGWLVEHKFQHFNDNHAWNGVVRYMTRVFVTPAMTELGWLLKSMKSKVGPPRWKSQTIKRQIKLNK